MLGLLAMGPGEGLALVIILPVYGDARQKAPRRPASLHEVGSALQQ
jgi:hypothetical protein